MILNAVDGIFDLELRAIERSVYIVLLVKPPADDLAGGFHEFVIDFPFGNHQGGNDHGQCNSTDEQEKGEKQGLAYAAQSARAGAPVAAFL